MRKVVVDAIVSMLIALVVWVACGHAAKDIDPGHWRRDGRVIATVLLAMGFATAFVGRRIVRRRVWMSES